MDKKRKKKIILVVSLIVGVLSDILLRLNSGEEGNLLVHSVFFLGSGLIAFGVIYGFLAIWSNFFKKEL